VTVKGSDTDTVGVGLLLTLLLRDLVVVLVGLALEDQVGVGLVPLAVGPDSVLVVVKDMVGVGGGVIV
jgi:hypothetical protein